MSSRPPPVPSRASQVSQSSPRRAAPPPPRRRELRAPPRPKDEGEPEPEAEPGRQPRRSKGPPPRKKPKKSPPSKKPAVPSAKKAPPRHKPAPPVSPREHLSAPPPAHKKAPPRHKPAPPAASSRDPAPAARKKAPPRHKPSAPSSPRAPETNETPSSPPVLKKAPPRHKPAPPGQARHSTPSLSRRGAVPRPPSDRMSAIRVQETRKRPASVQLPPLPPVPSPPAPATPPPPLPAPEPLKAPEDMTKRDHVVAEFQKTEYLFVQQVEDLMQKFAAPLVEQGLSRSNANLIFGNITELHRIHEHLYSELLVAGVNVGDVMVRNAAALEAYPSYINDYDKGSAAVTALEGTRLGTVLQGLSAGVHKGATGLESLRAAPLQRVPRYVLLLRELIKLTEEDHPERANLDKALTEMKRVANLINRAKREREREDRLLYIREHLDGPKTSLRETKLTAASKPHRFHPRRFKTQKECELCMLPVLTGSRALRCSSCKVKVHEHCGPQFPDDCEGVVQLERQPHELLAPHRRILEEEKLLHKATPLDQPHLISETPFQERILILFSDSVLILEEANERFKLVELVKFNSSQPGVRDATLEPNMSDTNFSISSYKHGMLHTFHVEDPEEKGRWTSTIGETMRAWLQSVKNDKDHNLGIKRRLEGRDVFIKGYVPVHSANEKPFNAYMIIMTLPGEEGELVILKRYSQLLELHKLIEKQRLGKDVKLPPFPSKSLFNQNEKVLAKRQRMLEAWLNALIKVEDVLLIDKVRSFFSTTVATGKEDELLEEFQAKKPETAAESNPVRFSYPPNFFASLGVPATMRFAFAGDAAESQATAGEGEEVIVLGKDHSQDWLWCRRVEDGSLGYIPRDFLQISEDANHE